MGGVFLDFDAICVEPMDELIYKYSYFSGLEPSQPHITVPVTSVGIIGAA
jgi:mannosyltransferase OCH1-like enzyme